MVFFRTHRFLWCLGLGTLPLLGLWDRRLVSLLAACFFSVFHSSLISLVRTRYDALIT